MRTPYIQGLAQRPGLAIFQLIYENQLQLDSLQPFLYVYMAPPPSAPLDEYARPTERRNLSVPQSWQSLAMTHNHYCVIGNAQWNSCPSPTYAVLSPSGTAQLRPQPQHRSRPSTPPGVSTSGCEDEVTAMRARGSGGEGVGRGMPFS